MIYRLRIYQAIPNKVPEFHRFFREHLLPIQLRHGARLLGRWETDDGRVLDPVAATQAFDALAELERLARRGVAGIDLQAIHQA